jgi:signal transduction histidine kinase
MRGGLIFAAWTLVGGLVLASSAARSAANGARFDVDQVLEHFHSVWLWALFTPLMFWLARRIPIARRDFARAFTLHVGCALLIHIIDVGADMLLSQVGFGSSQAAFGERIVDDLFINVYSYFAVIACGHALAYQALYQARRTREAELAAQLARTQLHALELQLRPHFLFNALNTVSAQIRTGASSDALQTLSQLGDLLRALLHDGAHEVSVRDELALVERYLSIEETRFGGRLTRSLDVDPQALNALLPRLILQPFAENAIHHGCENVRGPARVAISVQVRGERLRVVVQDTGTGISGRHERIGLGNARERLRRLYGDEHHLALEPVPNGGARTILEVPYHHEARALA